MLFWKRLQRSSSSSSSAIQERRFFGILRSAKRKDAVTSLPTYRQNNVDAVPTAAPAEEGLQLGYEEAGTVGLQAQQNDYVLEESALRVPLSPPPNYCPLPSTPPPSYTERPRSGQERRSHQADAVHPATPARVVAVPPSGATSAGSELAARQQARRRRRLRELQQQQLQFASSTDSSSSSGSSCSELVSGGSATRRHRRRRRGLRDAYCPDLLHACSLILQQPGSSDSSVGNFTATPPPPTTAPAPGHQDLRNPEPEESFEYSSDYVEIDELLPLVAGGRAKSTPQLAMGQNLSLRRPRISLTWVLREQQQTQTAPQTPAPPSPQKEVPKESADAQGDRKENEVYLSARTEPVPTQLDVTKKRYRVKQLPSGGEPLNGYATTPTAHQAPPNGHLANQKFFSNQNLLDVSRTGPSSAPPVAAASTKELLFVCTPQRAPRSDNHSEALLLARKRNEIRKKLASRLQQARSSAGSQAGGGGGAEARGSATGAESLKCTSYSEPSLVAASEGGAAAPQQQRRHRHRKRRDRNRVQRFGYEIHNVDEFLSRCSLATPGNIPVVLATASTLYQTRPGGYQLEIPLPLGMVVNAVFKNQNWLYVQTPHAEEGYVGYACCLPLGILPQQARNGSRNTPCWESNADVFPRPCGNMTDSEKEIRLRGGTRSDGARTPRSSSTKAAEDQILKISASTTTTINNNNNHSNNNNQTNNVKGGSTASSLYGEQQVDMLYLRAASKPRLVEKAYAQLRSTRQVAAASGSASAKSGASQDEYVTLKQKSVKKQPNGGTHLHQSHQPAAASRRLSNVSYITNGQNGQHLHPKLAPLVPPPYEHKPAKNQAEAEATLKALRRRQEEVGQRQTLVAINTDYITESIAVHKGEIVTLCECRESKDQRQWFYIRTRDGREGFIPAEVAGHGYL
ncbi:uncharacterized protein LOC128259507 [Drosophila gunungcola]|uniref:uncharacterized protein LOC128259507 n=1 Tax=Drosophila gunungcola TaxID=103775 RepID=UPI0022E2A066|nr:uncharacterized protein LOC128259507 [Drosophila gunungcola]